MKWQIIVVGKPALSWAREGAADYLRRLRSRIDVELRIEGARPAHTLATRMIEAAKGSLCVVLDERGKMMGSRAFAGWIGQRELAGCKRVSILIGGAEGHHAAVREAADEVWSLSAMTLQHELALVVFLEQLYRACAIQRGEPYHRD